MPELLEQPTQSRRYSGLIPFTSERATLAGQRSGESRRERAAAKRAAKLTQLAQHVQEAAEPDARLTLLEEQIRRTRKVLNDDRADWCPACERGGLSGKDRAGLLRALCGLLEQQRIARGEPLPGSRRPRADDRTPAAPAAYRIREESGSSTIAPAAQAPPACGPDTPSSSVLQQAPSEQRPQEAESP